MIFLDAWGINFNKPTDCYLCCLITQQTSQSWHKMSLFRPLSCQYRNRPLYYSTWGFAQPCSQWLNVCSVQRSFPSLNIPSIFNWKISIHLLCWRQFKKKIWIKKQHKNLRFMVFFELPQFTVMPKIHNRSRNREWFCKEVVNNHTELAKEEDFKRASLTSLTIKANTYFFWTPFKGITSYWQG